MIDSAHPSTFRNLGAFEHIIDLYISRNPVQFSIAIELTARVVPEDVVKALVAVQRAHPMLMARIDRTDVLPAFRRGGSPVPLRILDTDDWVAVSGAEQATPIDPDAGPLLRAAYVARPEGDAFPVVILTFSHQIADGRGALRAVRDLLEALEGRALAAQPLPASQEELLASMPDAPASPANAPSTPTSERAMVEVRPFDGIAPTIEIAALDRRRTAHLRDRARTEGATVQGVLCAAVAQVLCERGTPGSIRINVPIDLRSAAGLPDAVVNRFTATTIELGDPTARDLWSLARDATNQLRAGRSTARAAALMLASLHPADAGEAEAAMLAATNADVEITNLGVLETTSDAASAVWGPTMVTQVRHERIIGVVTFDGSLRLTVTGHDDVVGVAAAIGSRLTTDGA